MERIVGRICRGLVVVAVVLAAVAVPASADIGNGTRELSVRTALDGQLLASVNAMRAERGLRPLRLSTELSTAARTHSLEMAEEGFFAHESADGAAFWKRIERFYDSSGFRTWRVGENLLWASPDVSAGGALQLWLRSPRHRAVLLDPRWREIGLSAVHAVAAPGAFKGLDVTIVTADFGIRTGPLFNQAGTR
jgi:uncharacterized protein YkwD